MRDTMVPKSLAAQRMNAKMLPEVNERTRRRRSRICSATGRPKRIQCSMCFSEPQELYGA